MNKKMIKNTALFMGIASISGVATNSLISEAKDKDITITEINVKSQIVDIPDENLKKGINNALRRGEVLDDITITEMESLTNLNIAGANIYSIKGLEYAINLNTLSLNNNKISDISPLKYLTNLSGVHLYNNKISDISTFISLKKIKDLRIGGNNISDISSLAYLSEISYLDISRNEISDMSCLGELTKLNTLEIGENKVIDISFIEKLVNLNKLNMSQIPISDLSVLENLTNLNTLTMQQCGLSDISILSNLNNLIYLNIQDNHISDLSHLRNLTNLSCLYIENNKINDISDLRNLTKLTNLNIGKNQIEDISPLCTLVNLTSLNMSSNNISDISLISNLTNITTLGISNNKISDISSISSLNNLHYLDMFSNNISDISSLKDLINLNVLWMHYNNINDISPLSNLLNLTTLSIEGNNITNLDALSKMNELSILYAQNNQISDISGLSSLSKLSKLYLIKNQITDISSLQNVKSLKVLNIGLNEISNINALSNLNDLEEIMLNDNLIIDISPIANLRKLKILNLSNQKPIIDAGDFKSETDNLDISINNPITGLFNKVSGITNVSNDGVYENGKLKWNNLFLGNYVRKFNFKENVKIGSATTTFNGTATINFNVIDGGAPEPDHTSEFDNNNFEIYTTVTANDLGVGVDYLIHKGARKYLPYRFKYDIFESINNIVEIYDAVGNKVEYEVKLKESDIPTIEDGLDTLITKDNIEKEDISYFRTIINNLDESMNKDLLQDRLNLFFTTETLEKKIITSNIDVYIKSENMLLMSVSTNSVMFEDYSGVEDLTLDNAIEISINSSLPYNLNSYILNDIQNSNKSKQIDLDRFNIKESSEDNYKMFDDINEKLILKESCNSGNNIKHKIDLKLKGGEAYEADIYKTVVKFEAEQK